MYEAYGLCYDNLGDMKRATDALLQAVCACKGPMLEQQRQLYSEYLLLLHHLPGISAEALRQRHWQYNDFFADCTIYTHQKKEKEKKEAENAAGEQGHVNMSEGSPPDAATLYEDAAAMAAIAEQADDNAFEEQDTDDEPDEPEDFQE